MEIEVRNWDKWQSYRKDRGAPPWIKLHRNLMSNKDWAKLSDAEKGQLCSMWIVAADKNGKLPSDPSIIRKICQLDADPNINKFAELGFFDVKVASKRRQGDAKVTPVGCQDDAPETEKRQRRDRGENGDAKTFPYVVSLSDIPESNEFTALLQSAAFVEAWGEWVAYRKEKRQPLKPLTAKSQLLDLSKYHPVIAIDALRQSIKNGWTGIFPEKIKLVEPPRSFFDEPTHHRVIE